MGSNPANMGSTPSTLTDLDTLVALISTLENVSYELINTVNRLSKNLHGDEVLGIGEESTRGYTIRARVVQVTNNMRTIIDSLQEHVDNI